MRFVVDKKRRMSEEEVREFRRRLGLDETESWAHKSSKKESRG